MKNLTVEDLRQEFDRVKIYYTAVGNKKVTRVGLVKGNNVFIGISECDPRDQFDKFIGRAIALGRAFFQSQVYECAVVMRGSSTSRRLAYMRYADPKIPIRSNS